MKTNWPAYRLACLLLVSLAILASPLAAQSGPPAVRVDATVSPHSVRIEAKAAGPFAYTTSRPSQSLVVVDLAGVVSTVPSNAQVLESNLVSSYRLIPVQTTGKTGTCLEVLLHAPVEPRLERTSPDQLALIFEEKTGITPTRRPLAAQVGSLTAADITISNVEVARAGEQTNVRIAGNGRLAYGATRLSSPDRLVLDFPGARLALNRPTIPSPPEPVRAVRLSQFKPGVTRVVIDLSRQVPYSITKDGKSVTVAFAATPGNPADGAAASVAPTFAPLAPVAASEMRLPETLTQNAALASPAPKSEPQAAAAAPTALANSPAPVADMAPQQQPQRAPSRYTGEPISVNLKDVDLKDFFRLIHEISGLNVVVDPSVKGTLTIVLDEVPWDQALDIVLANNNLDKRLEGNVLRVATKETLKKEAESRRDLARAEAEAVDPVTTTRVLSYAKATGLRDTLKRFLSSRGEILADERSNTLIIRDIPSVLPTLDNLIRQLDRKAAQVEIEARVVAASRSFARDIGTQFAFATATAGGRTVFGGASAVGTSPVIRPTGSIIPPLVSSGSSTTGVQMPLSTNLQAQGFGGTGPTSGATFAHTSPNFALDFILTAAETRGVGKLLSKPRVITQNNEKAIVKQGTRIPIQTTINNTISVQFIDAVLKLEVTPQITAEGTIFMEVVVENTQIDNGIPRVQGIPALDTQAEETKVLIGDGGTVVIGGIIISSQRTNISQVPLVGSIPVIGHLFKRTIVTVDSQELLFFLTPRIVAS